MMLTSLFRQKKIAFNVKSRRPRRKIKAHPVIVTGLIPYVLITIHHCALITAVKMCISSRSPHLLLVVVVDYEVRSWWRLKVFFGFRANAGLIRNREQMVGYLLRGLR